MRESTVDNNGVVLDSPYHTTRHFNLMKNLDLMYMAYWCRHQKLAELLL